MYLKYVGMSTCVQIEFVGVHFGFVGTSSVESADV